MFTNWISDLGRGPNGANVVFNSGMMVASIFFLIFQFHVVRNLHAKGKAKYQPMETKLELSIFGSYISGIIMSVGLFFIGCFPLNFNIYLHGIAANLYFFGAMFLALFCGISHLFVSENSRYEATIGFSVALIFGAYIIIAIIAIAIPEQIQSILYFSEWVSLFAIEFWAINGLIFKFVVKIRKYFAHGTLKTKI